MREARKLEAWKSHQSPENALHSIFRQGKGRLGASQKKTKLRIRIRDAVLFDPWVRNPGWVKSQDPDPGWTTRDPGWKKFGSGNRDKHTGSATLDKSVDSGMAKEYWVFGTNSVGLFCFLTLIILKNFSQLFWSNLISFRLVFYIFYYRHFKKAYLVTWINPVYKL